MKYNWDVLDPLAYNNKMGHYKFTIQYNFIMKHLVKNYKKILDVGGGSGRFAIPIFKSGRDITVLEQRDEALELLLSRCPDIKTVCCDFLEYDCKEKFDFIFSIEVVNLINNWDLFFEKIYYHLNPGGKFVFTTVNPKSWREKLRKLHPHFQGYYHPIDEVVNIIQRHSLTIEEIKGFCWQPFKVNSNCLFIDFFAKIEVLFGLNYFISQSPFLILAVVKNDNKAE